MEKVLRRLKKPAREIVREALRRGMTVKPTRNGVFIVGPGDAMLAVHHDLNGRNEKNCRADFERLCRGQYGAKALRSR